MTQTAEVDPRCIRFDLGVSRAQGLQFAAAWAVATKPYDTKLDVALFAFMREHFRAAYKNDKTPLGRCLVPELDTSNALLFTHRPKDSSDHKRCRSGDGCDREATRGRFGRTFCEYHGTELERIGTEIEDCVDRHNPRKHGNRSIGRAAA